MWYTEPDNTDVVEGNPMKGKTYQTRCGTIHYWANASNPDIRRAVALENLISDGRQPDIAEIQTRIRVTVDDNAFSVTAGGLSSRTVHRLFLPRRPPCSGGVQGDLFQYRVKSVAHGIAVGDAFQHSEVIFPIAECRSFFRTDAAFPHHFCQGSPFVEPFRDNLQSAGRHHQGFASRREFCAQFR